MLFCRFCETFFHGYPQNAALATTTEMCCALYYDETLTPEFFIGAQTPIENSKNEKQYSSTYDQPNAFEVSQLFANPTSLTHEIFSHTTTGENEQRSCTARRA